MKHEKPDKVFKFNEQLKLGQAGEEFFVDCYSSLKPVFTDGRKSDIIIQNKHKIELKTDYYEMSKTENFFIERYSDFNKKTSGGPWRTKTDRVKFFVYFYIKNKVFYWFDTKTLILEIEKNIDKYETRLIKNKSYNTFGYLVPRVDIEDIALRIDDFSDNVPF